MALMRVIALAVMFVTVCHNMPSYAAEVAKAQIDGPSESKAGNMVVLNTVASQADETRWIIPDELEGRYIQIGTQLAFSVREAGKFRFYLIAVSHEPDETDGTGRILIDVDDHTVTITDGFGECPPVDPGEPDQPDDPGQPDDPSDPAPPGDFTELRQFSRDAAKQLNDPTTARRLVAAIKSVSVGNLADMQKAAGRAIEDAFLQRRGDSEDVPWDIVWRIPANALIAGMDVTTGEQYKQALAALAAGLEDSLSGSPAQPPTSPPVTDKVSIIFYTQGNNCPHCVRWDREVRPILADKPGWTIEDKVTRGAAPQFDVTVDGKTRRIVGAVGADTFVRTVAELSR